nr:uncharacterized protein LOC127328673 [Lolium perenne]
MTLSLALSCIRRRDPLVSCLSSASRFLPQLTRTLSPASAAAAPPRRHPPATPASPSPPHLQPRVGASPARDHVPIPARYATPPPDLQRRQPQRLQKPVEGLNQATRNRRLARVTMTAESEDELRQYVHEDELNIHVPHFLYLVYMVVTEDRTEKTEDRIQKDRKDRRYFG